MLDELMCTMLKCLGECSNNGRENSTKFNFDTAKKLIHRGTHFRTAISSEPLDQIG
jgi:hypothetical protein